MLLGTARIQLTRAQAYALVLELFSQLNHDNSLNEWWLSQDADSASVEIVIDVAGMKVETASILPNGEVNISNREED